jgi:hypothetical protein
MHAIDTRERKREEKKKQRERRRMRVRGREKGSSEDRCAIEKRGSVIARRGTIAITWGQVMRGGYRARAKHFFFSLFLSPSSALRCPR